MHFLDKADDYPSELAPNNAYRRTLRKLWARMTEKDYRYIHTLYTVYTYIHILYAYLLVYT
jgi:hypothetical protein